MAGTGDLGKQAELLTQINSLLERRCQLESNLAKSCSKQGAMAQEAAASLDQQSQSLEKVGGGWTEVNKALDEGAKKQKESKKQSEGFLKGLLNKSKGLIGATAAVGALVKGFKGLTSVGKAVAIGLKSVVKSLFNVGKSILKIPFKVFSGLLATANEAAEMGVVLRQAWEDVRKEFGSFAEGPGKSVKGAIAGLSKESSNLAGTGLSVGQVFGFGPEGTAKMIQETGALAKALGPNLGMMGEEFKKSAGSAVMFSKGLGLSADQMAGLMKDAKLSGKSQSDMMQEIGNQSLQMAEKFGLSSKDIGRDIADMKKGFVTFGNMSTKTMAASSAYARKLGMDMKDLKGVVDKFDDFEGAAESVGQLNQAFGIQLDTMKMMNAENPAERIDMMRKAFFAAGKSIESMNRHEKKLLMTQTGLSESALKNAFSAENQGVAYEDFADAAETAEEQQLSQAEVMKKLAKGIERITKIAMKFSSIFDAIFKGFDHFMKTSPKMQKLWKQIRGMMWAFFELGKVLAEFFVEIADASGLLSALMEYFDPAPIKAFTKGIRGPLLELSKWIATGKGNPDELFKSFFEKFETLFSQRGTAGVKVAGSIGRLGTMFSKLFGKMVDFLIPKIVSAFSGLFEKIGNYLKSDAGKKLIVSFKETLVKAVGGAFKLAFSAGGALIKEAGSAISGWFKKDMPNALNAGAKVLETASGLSVGAKVLSSIIPSPVSVAIKLAAFSKNMEKMEDAIDPSIQGVNRRMAQGAGAWLETLTFGLMPDHVSGEFGNFIGGLLGHVGKFFDHIGLGTAWTGILDIIDSILTAFESVGDLIRGLFSSDPALLQKGLEGLFKTVWKLFKGLGKVVFGIISGFFTKLVPFVFKALLKVGGTILLWFVTELPKMILRGALAIGEAVLGAIYSLFKFFTDDSYRAEMFERVKSFFSGIWQGAVESLSKAWDWIVCWASDLWTRFKEFWGIGAKGGTKMGDEAGSWVDDIMKPISTLWCKVKAAMGRVWKSITDVFAPVGKFFGKVGKSIKTAMMKPINWIRDKLRALFAKLPGFIKKRLGISSPSKVFQDEIGGPMGEGMTGGFAAKAKSGMTKAMDLVKKVAAKLAPKEPPKVGIVDGIKSETDQMKPMLTAAATSAMMHLGKVMSIGAKYVGKIFTSGISNAVIGSFKTSKLVPEFQKIMSQMGSIFTTMIRLVTTNMNKLSKIIGIMGKKGMGITRFSLFSRQNKDIFYSLAKLFGNMVTALRKVKWATVIQQLDNTAYAVGQIEKTFSTLANINIVDVGSYDFFQPSFSDQVVEGYTNLAVMFAKIKDVSDYYLGDMNQAPTHNIYKAVMASANIAKTMNRHYLGRNGRVVSVVSDLVDTYNATYNALDSISRQPANLMVKLENFANALGMDSSTFTVENEKLNFTINVGVVIDAEKMVDTLADRSVMGERTLKTVTGFAPFE